MKKKFKFLAFLASVGGVLYIARDQVKEIVDKVKEVVNEKKADSDSFEDPDDDFEFPESNKDDRDYVSINITDDDATKATEADAE